MLPKSHHVQQVYYAGENSLLSAQAARSDGQPSRLFIECSTIDPAVTREVGAKVQEAGLGGYADAAVSVRASPLP